MGIVRYESFIYFFYFVVSRKRLILKLSHKVHGNGFSFTSLLISNIFKCFLGIFFFTTVIILASKYIRGI